MMLVDRSTGEIVEPLSYEDAVALTNSIRESVADLEQQVVQAYFGRVWVPMDYASWDDYILGEFKRAPLQLPREERQTQVAFLRAQGLSLRAIGAATGVSEATVRRESGATYDAPERVTGVDGKEYPSIRPVPSPEELEARRDETDRADAIRRTRDRLIRMVDGWTVIKNLADNPFRSEVLAGLISQDRHVVEEIEALYQEHAR